MRNSPERSAGSKWQTKKTKATTTTKKKKKSFGTMMNHFDVEADAAAMRRSWHISLRVIREQREGREREKKKF